MKALVIPLICMAIFADVYCMWNWENISAELYYKGETLVYFTWVLAFWIYVKWTPTEFSKRIITLLLLSWLPFCLYAIWKEFNGEGLLKFESDLYSAFISLALVIGQIIFWWYKNKKHEAE